VGLAFGRAFAITERSVKVYEYNADSCSCHMETGYVQGRWAEHFGCSVGRDPGADLRDHLIAAWRESGVDDLLHIMQDRDLEETYHALFMKSAMEAAGIRCKIVKGTSSLQWDDDGWVCDAEGVRIKWVWKTWAWETALDQIRHELDDDAEELRLHQTIDHRRHAPRLVDVLLREEVMVYEPLWTLVTSNKAILPVVKSMFPSSRFLLDAHFDLTDGLRQSGYVAKPIVGRWGANIAIVNRNDEVVAATEGKFDDRDTVYQELFRLPVVDGHNVQIGTFSASGTYAGACVRVDRSPIIGWSSDLLPLRVVPDSEFLDAIA
jgi:glutathionylspermidine amidase/synthetase